MGVVFILDSGSDFEKENQINIKTPVEVIPLNIHFGEEVYLDGVDLSKEEFYAKMSIFEELPKTSQPSPQAFYDGFKRHLDKGCTVVSLSIASDLSGTFQSATIAKDMLSEEEQTKVFLIDTKNVSVTILHMLKYADTMLLEGKAVEEVVQWIEAHKDQFRIYALLDTLENLKKGGRISQTQAFIGGLLNIKPMVTIEEGKVETLGKSRGRKRGLKELSTYVDGIGGLNKEYLFVAHSFDTVEEATSELDLIIDQTQFDHTLYYKLGSTIGTHAGKNTLGIGVYKL
jgi:DegV family protein with EDD domain